MAKKGIICLLILINTGFSQNVSSQPVFTITSVYDNYEYNPDLKTSWGLACVIETIHDKILFDTGGNSKISLSNMNKMGIDPDSIDKIIISHNHSDHLGGLAGFLEENSDVIVFIPASFSRSVKNMIHEKGAQYVEVSDNRKISENVYSTGEIYGPPIEQSLVLDSPQGLVVITGCAHPGIVKIVQKAQKIMGKDVFLVMGGFHHPPASVVSKFRELGVQKVAPSHCTGDPIREKFVRKYKDYFIKFGAGRIIEIR